ncbi:hypothetical protein JQC67_17240 [Aurantibacter crassamenti]|uniref:hypothetical protein n=1 Tax=Aurantibacter crassamenti TaxID=1837375 RepID=UPI00193AC653|nr:hypothetical protein [Aurantibacter crassamenti]MBM1107903.1 hypothetical protein [Aurantibacter crassamenti]
MELLITTSIYIHAFLGGLGLITGVGSMAVKKGSGIHKKMGKIFSISMIASCILILPITWVPGHISPFLFLISLFTIYLVLVGNLSLTFKKRDKLKADSIDKGLSIGMAIFSIFMLVYGIYGLFNTVQDNALFLVFGGLGLFLTFRNFQFYKNFKEKKIAWLLSHLTFMIAALIASFTAFIVAGLHMWNIVAWVTPSIIGTIYIIYWRRKMKAKIAS